MSFAGRASHAQAAARFVRDRERTAWHDRALRHFRDRRDRAARAVEEWERLRERAAEIKGHAIRNLGRHVREFERRAAARGVRVHFALDAAEHNRIVYEILSGRGVRRVVKSKSMLTEECGLNPYLEERGIEVTDTDLGERIVQLRGERPSHITAPAIHLKRGEVSDLFCERLGTERGNADPAYLTEAARGHLREAFLGAGAGITGVNFAVADAGALVVVTNEGNADLGTALPPLHIACCGIDKIVPRMRDLGVLVRLLARSATGQAISVYTSHFFAPAPGGELHVVLVDNGRTRLLADPDRRRLLTCVRCGACLNTCPVYRRSGGHSYGVTVSGPIGAALFPALDPRGFGDLAYACTLCGSCTDVCPVKIDLHPQILRRRRELFESGSAPLAKRALGGAMAAVFSRPRAFGLASGALWFLLRSVPEPLRRRLPFFRARDLGDPPRESFRDWYRRNRRG